MPREKLPYVNLFHRDFAHGVRGMPSNEVGDYIRLLCAMWDTVDGTLPMDVNRLHLALECRRSDVAKRITALVDRGKLFIGSDGLIHNSRTDRDRRTVEKALSAQVAGNLPGSSPQLAGKLSLDNAKKRGKSKGQVHGLARAPVTSITNSKSSLSALDDLDPQKSNGSASASHGSPGLEGRSPNSPSERESTGPPNYADQPVQATDALLRSLERMKPRKRR